MNLIDWHSFVKSWQLSASVAEVASRTGLAKQTVTAYATRLRRIGVKLKKFPTRPGRGKRNPPDVEALNTLLETL